MAASDHRYYKKIRNDITRWPIKLLSNIRRRCKVANIPCSLTVDDIVIPATCPVLGIPIYIGTGRPCDNSPSIDRVNPDGGYTKGNIIVVSQKANRIKSDATVYQLQQVFEFYRDLEAVSY